MIAVRLMTCPNRVIRYPISVGGSHGGAGDRRRTRARRPRLPHHRGLDPLTRALAEACGSTATCSQQSFIDAAAAGVVLQTAYGLVGGKLHDGGVPTVGRQGSAGPGRRPVGRPEADRPRCRPAGRTGTRSTARWVRFGGGRARQRPRPCTRARSATSEDLREPKIAASLRWPGEGVGGRCGHVRLRRRPRDHHRQRGDHDRLRLRQRSRSGRRAARGGLPGRRVRGRGRTRVPGRRPQAAG